MQALYYEDRIVCEGASAVGIAAMLTGKFKAEGTTATIITGRNLDMTQHAAIMTGQDIILGDVTVKGESYGA